MKFAENCLVYRLSGLELSSELPVYEEETALVEECDDPQYKEPAGDDDSAEDEDREDMPVDSQQNTFVKQWESRTFLKPYRVLLQLSAFPNLTMLYSIFCCLSVSSASAERALSKVKIIKNRLRTSVADKTYFSLLYCHLK